MNILIIYDSQFGNTALIAQAISGGFRDTGQVHVVTVGAVEPAAQEKADVLVVGSPTQGWRATQATLTFLQGLSARKLKGMPVACFDTRFQQPRWLTGSAARGIGRALTGMRASMLVPPESFFVTGKEGPLVDGEIERAAAWARKIAGVLTSNQPPAPQAKEVGL